MVDWGHGLRAGVGGVSLVFGVEGRVRPDDQVHPAQVSGRGGWWAVGHTSCTLTAPRDRRSTSVNPRAVVVVVLALVAAGSRWCGIVPSLQATQCVHLLNAQCATCRPFFRLFLEQGRMGSRLGSTTLTTRLSFSSARWAIQDHTRRNKTKQDETGRFIVLCWNGRTSRNIPRTHLLLLDTHESWAWWNCAES